MPPRTAPEGQSDTPEGEVEVIMDNQHLFWRNLEIPQHLTYSLTTAVHEGDRLQEKNLLSIN